MTYGKEIKATAISDHSKGATATEIQKHLTEVYNVKPCTNTIYDWISNVTIEQIVDELMRQQERDITKESDSDLRMHYRNELLKLLMPAKQEIISKSLNVNKNINETTFNLKSYSEEDKTAILDVYRRICKNNSAPAEPTSIH